jgi:hypothetical protein
MGQQKYNLGLDCHQGGPNIESTYDEHILIYGNGASQVATTPSNLSKLMHHAFSFVRAWPKRPIPGDDHPQEIKQHDEDAKV